jgi:two-component system sensor histidine kinase VicK
MSLPISSSTPTRLLAMVAHDLRNPLNTILGMTQLMRMESERLSADQQQYLKTIDEACRRANLLVDDLVESQALQEEVTPLVRMPMDLNILLAYVCQRHNTAAEERKIQLIYQPASQPLEASVHFDKFGRILDNLIGNALKFTPPGGQITLQLGTEAEQVWIAIEDTGIGIPDDMLPHLFDKFTVARRLGLHGERPTGLGLSIVQQLLMRHEGRIEVTSTPHKGTRFVIYLPMAVSGPNQSAE